MAEARMQIPRAEFAERIRRLQLRMAEAGIDVLITHACECESANVRYLSNFWAVFDFAGVIVPIEGDAILFTGGPESYDFARRFAQIDDIRINPLYVETSAPEWDKETDSCSYGDLFDEFRHRFVIKQIGVANTNILPYRIMNEIRSAAKDATIVSADDLLLKLRWTKSPNEIIMMKEAYRITEEAVKKTISSIKPGKREWEIEATWRACAYELGAEGTSYPVWVTSGPSTLQSLCRSSEREIESIDVVQLTFGAKYGGYCGNMCRPVVLGSIPLRQKEIIGVANDLFMETIESIRPGIAFATLYEHFQDRLKSEGLAGLSLYGPAHGTGLQECEGPWVDNRNDYSMQPGMIFNVDIWIADSKYGVRFEDGVLVTETGLENLSSWHRAPIELD